MKKARKRSLALFVAAFTLFTSIFGNVNLKSYADDAQATEVIASLAISSAEEIPAATDGLAGFSAVGLTLGNAEYTGLGSGNIAAKKFAPGSYWEFAIDATRYENIAFSMKARMSKTGPGDFVLEYALDGSGEFTPIKSVSAKNNGAWTGNFTLDASEAAALSGHAFKLRLTVSEGAKSVADGNIAENGTMGINNIVFTGTKIGGEVVPPTPVCSDVYVVGGVNTVKAGETVSLACDTEGAVIYYNANGTENFSVYEAPIVINEDTVIKAFAQLEGYTDSNVSTFNVTVEKAEPDVTGNEPDVTGNEPDVTGNEPEEPEVVLPFKDGDTVAIVVADTALNSTVVSDKYLGGTPVTKDGDTVVIPSEAATLKVVVTEEGVAFLNTENNKYLASTEKGGTLLFQDELNAASTWILEQAEGGWLLKVAASKDAAKPQYIEWYGKKSNFTTYGYNEKYKSDYTANFYPVTGGDTPDPDNKLPFKDGDVVAIVTADTALNATVVSNKYLGGTPVTKDGETVVVPSDAAAHKVIVTEEGVAFLNVDNNKYLASTQKGGTIFYQDALDAGATWILEETEGGFLVKVAASAVEGSKPQYIEWNAKYKDFTTYGYNEKYKSDYLTNFFPVNTGYKIDTDTVLTVAQWGGGAELDASVRSINGDLYASNDCLDTASVFTAVVGGNVVVPFTSTKSTNTGSTNYYMGATGLGTGGDDYMQLALSSKGYGAMKLSFRLRSSNTAPGEFTLKYSVNGTDFYDFANGSASYVVYNVGEKTADITNGVAKTSLNPAAYVSFSFDVPEGAENADSLIIRFIPGTTAAKSGSELKTGGVVRIDSVSLVGSPVIDPSMCGYVKVSPAAGEVALGQALTMTSATADAKIYYSINGGEFTEYNAEAKPVLETLPASVRTYSSNGTLADSITINNYYTQLKCEGVKAKPNGGAVVLNEKVRFTALTEGADILYRFSDTEVWTKYTEPVKLTELPCQIYVKSVKDGCLDSEVKTLNFTEKSGEKYNIYFGQLHSHTSFSDGSGTCEEAFAHATKVANLDFLAVTDHSNSLDHESESKIDTNVDTAETDEWTLGHALAKKYSSDTFTCLYGYEMTWSNGLGHMNTYNTPGFQSRTQKAYTTYSTALNNYYSALETVPDSISMFNHPGTTFGDFQDFAYYTPARDELINLIEVGNGEGAIGSSGYFPSYEYYTRALDKGWHIAPTNNQDNHKGLWGDANTARSVVLANANTEEEIYQAMKDRRMYATEDNNLSIYYTLDGHILGTILDKEDVGEEVEIKVEIKDPDNESIGDVEVIVNGGLSIAHQYVSASEETVTFKVPSSYSYYYIWVGEEDGDIAVTAPVWVGEVEACGINKVSTETTLAVKDESLDINIDFFNNEKVDLEVTEITIDILDAEGVLTRIATLTGDELANVAAVKSNSTASLTYNYVYGNAGKITYIVNATAKLAGADKLYTGKLTVNYAAPEMVGEVIIDATHSNDYVAGYYMNNVNNFVAMAAKYNLRANIVKDKITSETLKGAKLLVISAPGVADTRNNPPLYEHKTFEPEFIEAVRQYVADGGRVVVCGIADYNNYQAGVQVNALLEGIGSTIRINSDECMDDTHNGGQAYRLYPENFNMSDTLLWGVQSKDANPEKYQVYSQYSGCSVDVSNAVENDVVLAAEKLVMGFDTTYSVDCKDDKGNKLTDSEGNPNIKNDNMGDVTFLAHQYTKAGGEIIVAGGVFLSDFEVKAEIDNNDSLPYANATIADNILCDSQVQLPISTIREARQGNTGDVFHVEGYVTAGTANEYNTFFDTIYIQDETGGIDIFPYAYAGLELGTKVEVVGYVSSYQGDLELKVIRVGYYDFSCEPKKIVEPAKLSTKDAMDYANHGGELIKTEGTVTRVLVDNGVLSEFWVKDASGAEAAIFIDGYITSGTTGKNNLADTVKVGTTASGVGVLYMHPEGDSDVSVPVLRVRNCDEILVVPAPGPGPEVKNGIYEENGGLYYYANDKKTYAGLVDIDGAFYYAAGGGAIVRGNYYAKLTNGIMDSFHADFDEVTGKMIINGIKKVYGADRYYKNGDLQKNAGVVKVGAYFYYVDEEGKIVKTPEVEVTKTNGRIPAGTYKTGSNGILILDGVLTVDGKTLYYKNNKIGHRAGLVECNGDFYYVIENGELATGFVTVSKTNGLKEYGVYEFDADGKMITDKNGFYD
ncbi:MAG: CehA/McbA family metallohydrolase, partial [Lachnospiraceae bacterium]|nr:CehA/McbA family metallohydrolase [Lachnospiraceae bacterium]